MSIVVCKDCTRYIDTDFHVEEVVCHEDEFYCIDCAIDLEIVDEDGEPK